MEPLQTTTWAMPALTPPVQRSPPDAGGLHQTGPPPGPRSAPGPTAHTRANTAPRVPAPLEPWRDTTPQSAHCVWPRRLAEARRATWDSAAGRLARWPGDGGVWRRGTAVVVHARAWCRSLQTTRPPGHQ